MKNKLINILVIVCIVLLGANVIYDIAREEEPVPVVHPSRDLIEKKFVKVLDDFSINLEWIDLRHIDNEEYDSLEYVYYVKVPKGVSVINIIRDVNAEFIDDKVEIVTEEREINGRSVLKVFAEEQLKMEAFLTPDTNLVRDYAKFAFVLTDIDLLDEAEIDTLRDIGYPYAAALVPTEESKLMLDSLASPGNEFFVLLNDDLDDNYELAGDMKKPKLRRQVDVITDDFGRAKIYLFDPGSRLFASLANNYITGLIREEANRVITLSSLTDLRNNELADLVSLLDFYTDSGLGKEGRVFFISADDFLRITGFLNRYIKKGNKLLFPSVVL